MTRWWLVAYCFSSVVSCAKMAPARRCLTCKFLKIINDHLFIILKYISSQKTYCLGKTLPAGTFYF
jgi:hypothetical protein